ncbi:MAG: methyl-accepting chemotaxis protein [Brevinematales bacterium]|jgi:uncharacterized protein YoxC
MSRFMLHASLSLIIAGLAVSLSLITSGPGMTLSLLLAAISFVLFIVLFINRKNPRENELSASLNSLTQEIAGMIKNIEAHSGGILSGSIADRFKDVQSASGSLSLMQETCLFLLDENRKCSENDEKVNSYIRKLIKNAMKADFTRKTLIPVINDMIVQFNDFTKKIIVDLISQFSDISKNNKLMAGGIEQSMMDLMNDNKTDNLAFILKESGRLISEFDIFYSAMEGLKKEWDEFTDKTAGMLKNIGESMNSIQQVSDTIKLISLNVSIQAVNAGDNTKGFQILAKDLRQFTIKTTKFSNEVKDRVKLNQASSAKLTVNYVSHMNMVYDSLNGMKNSIENFGAILSGAVKNIRGTIQNLEDFTARIEKDMKKVIGQLQFYDITSQGTSHIGKLFEAGINEDEPGGDLNEDEKTLIREMILMEMKRLITTEPERLILEKYEKIFGISVHNEINIENKASKALKDGENPVIIF